jgi:hypothetical protein
MKTLALLLALLANQFRPAVPSTGRLALSVQAEISYSWSFEAGIMVILLDGAPAGTFAIEARRKVAGRDIVVGRSADICRCAPGPIEVAVWPVGGRVLRAGDYPVLLMEAVP